MIRDFDVGGTVWFTDEFYLLCCVCSYKIGNLKSDLDFKHIREEHKRKGFFRTIENSPEGGGAIDRGILGEGN